ncbi:MAG TPA: ArsR family transcriptional regulator, partial [Candidatus Bathyarchaeia archaeon]|nr:ArsR family transcriptional regulator [Candidatus Bathyarchaeia archaeon]
MYSNDTNLTENSIISRDSSIESTQWIFFELASDQRLSILFKLNRQQSNLSKLAKHLNVTIQEVHRNLNRLMDAGLIEKDSAGIFSLTTFGNIIINQIPTFDFLSRNKEYFSTHTCGEETPMKFIHRIGELNTCEFVTGLVAVIELWKQRIYRESTQYIYGMLPQIPLDLIETVIPKIKEDIGIKFNYILPQKAMVPKKRAELLKSAGFHEFIKKGIVERRMVDRIQVAILLNEKQATVMFPTAKGLGEPDMNSVFYSEDPLFHEWCLDYFRYRWYNSKSFDE